MKLCELMSEPSVAGCDPCAEVVRAAKRRQPPYNRPVEVGRVDGDGRSVVIVTNEEGLAEYVFMYPDGHLGAVTEDC